MKLSPNDFEVTPLAAYGLIAIACVFAFLGLEKLASAESAAERNVIAAQTELATLSTISETDHWADRLAQSTQARAKLQSELWQGSTSGVIAAQLQQSIRGLAAEMKFDQLQVRVDPDPVDAAGVSVLSFEFSGRAPSSKTFADFFEAIAVMDKIVIIEEFDFSQSLRDRRPPRLLMSGFIPVQITAPSTASNGGAN